MPTPFVGFGVGVKDHTSVLWKRNALRGPSSVCAYAVPSNSSVALSVARRETPSLGAYHQSVVTPTGNVYVACLPRNSIVVLTGVGAHAPLFVSYQLRTTSEYRSQSALFARAVTYAVVRSAQFWVPPTETPMRWANGPFVSLGVIAFDAAAMA